MEDFKQDNISCKVILTQQDRLGLINQEWEHATGSDGVWQESRCNRECSNHLNFRAKSARLI